MHQRDLDEERGIDSVERAFGVERVAALNADERAMLAGLLRGAIFGGALANGDILGSASVQAASLRNHPAPIRWFLLHAIYNGVLKWPSAAQRFQWETLSASGMNWTMVFWTCRAFVADKTL